MSKSGAYYNEIDPKAAAWLRELVKRGHIANGEVDERSIVDVAPDDLRGFAQCHFFAGIGVWSYALRRAGWADDRPVWTGSCPCQPFSAAGARGGVADERHLWPHWHHLISQCRPAVVFGEQVASKDGLGWLDLVQADLEGTGYASGAADLCAAGVGAPHIRQRLWFVGLADADLAGRPAQRGGTERAGECDEAGVRGATSGLEHSIGDGSQGGVRGWPDAGRATVHRSVGCDGTDRGLADAHGGDASAERQQRGGEQRQQPQDRGTGGLGDPSGTAGQRNAGTLSGAETGEHGARLGGDGGEPVGFEHASASVGGLADADHSRHGVASSADGNGQGAACHTVAPDAGSDDAGGLADASSLGWGGRQRAAQWREHDGPDAGWQQSHDGSVGGYEVGDGSHRPGPANGHWRDADWLFCRDGKWRPVESGTFPLAHGSAARVGRLRGYGNAIAAPAAQAFIESVMEISNV